DLCATVDLEHASTRANGFPQGSSGSGDFEAVRTANILCASTSFLENTFLLNLRTMPDAPAHQGGSPSHTASETAQPAASSFAALGIARDLVDALKRASITTPTPIQALTIPDALAGLD